jgi:hypothetical protein
MPVVAVAFAVDGQWTAVGSGELTPAACASSETPAHFSLASVRGRVSLTWRAYRPVDPAALDDEIVVGANRPHRPDEVGCLGNRRPLGEIPFPASQAVTCLELPYVRAMRFRPAFVTLLNDRILARSTS